MVLPIGSSSEYPFGYAQFKTPVFKLEIAKSPTSKFGAFPHQIMRLMSKLELTEASGVPDTCVQTTATLVFTTGSREPFPALNTSSAAALYKTNSERGLTNAVSMLADLQFSFNSGGISFTSEATGTAESLLAATEDALDYGGSLVAAALNSGPSFTRQKRDTSGSYVFKEGNALKLTWGYAESPSEHRTKIFVIKTVQMDFPENEAPSITIMCQTAFANGEAISPMKPQSYYAPYPAGLDPTAGPAIGFKGLSVQAVLAKLSLEVGMDLIISPNIKASIPEGDAHITWPAGVPLSLFLRDLAAKYNAVTKLEYSPKSGKPVIVFMSRTDFYGKTVLPGDYFWFKRSGSIVKSVNMRCDFGGLTGAGLLGMDSDGSDGISHASEVAEQEQILLGEGQKLVNANSGKNEAGFKPLIDNISDSAMISRAEYTPMTNKENIKYAAGSKEYCSRSKLIAIELSTIGHPHIRPGSIRLQGIGQRYSGFYQIKIVTHTIDSTGYTCKLIGNGYGLGEGGVVQPASDLSEAEGQIEVKLSNPTAALGALKNATSSGVDSVVVSQYASLDLGEPDPLQGLSNFTSISGLA